MSRQRTRDTAAEVAIRRVLHRRGLRFRVNFRPIAGLRTTADIAFTRARVAVYVDGCFWHSCPQHATVPRSNREWWISKLAKNQERDRATDEALAVAGWMSMRVWEHEVPDEAAARIAAAVAARNQMI
jgi:DNA mismatch endonuclease (patch repair protein)